MAAIDHQADLIVMATHGRTGIQRAVLGSIAGHRATSWTNVGAAGATAGLAAGGALLCSGFISVYVLGWPRLGDRGHARFDASVGHQPDKRDQRKERDGNPLGDEGQRNGDRVQHE